MRVLVVDDYSELSRAGSRIVAEAIRSDPAAAVVVATGDTPMGVYGGLAGTAGLAQLVAARQTLLLVSGAHKAGILRRVVEGPQSPDVPAAYLHRAANVTVLADRAAASMIKADVPWM